MNYLFEDNEYSFDTLDLNLSFNEDGKTILTNSLQLFLQEIYLAVTLGPGEIWGVKDAIDLQQYLFNRYITTNFINSEMTTYIGLHCSQAKNHRYEINSEIIQDENNKDLIVIRLNLYDTDGKQVLKTFILGQ